MMDNNAAIAQGLVPSLVQSSALAELFAAHAALRWALRFAARVCLHSDNEYVVNGLNHLRRFRQVSGCWKYYHVWLQVLEVLHLLDTDAWDAHYVPAHQDETSATSSLQEWFIRGNSKADGAATRAQQLRPANFISNG